MTDAIIIDDSKQLELMCFLAKLHRPGFHTEDYFKVNASWQKESRTGIFKVQFMLPKAAFLESQSGNFGKYFQELLPAILGLWFDLFPLHVSELRGSLKTSTSDDTIKEMFRLRSRYGGSLSMNVAPFHMPAEDAVRVVRKSLKSRLGDQNDRRNPNDDRISLEPSNGSRFAGGVCVRSSSANPFRDAIIRWFRERFVFWADRDSNASALIEKCHGAIHRGNEMNVLDALLGFESAVIAELCYRKDISDSGYTYWRRGKQTIQEVMIQLENLGHESEDLVEGLTIELLDFQRQSLKWALEREQVSGGVQSYHWPKLPSRGQGHQDDLYYNPLLGKFRSDKPRVVRGGFIAEEMGLGKTVISLALILKNPAPAFPLSGSPISVLKASKSPDVSSTSVPSERYGWEKELYEQTYTGNTKKGSIICRGTLVICPVSLVGQWVSEAKSKLKEPGLVYSYHGTNRKRDPTVLAANSIVVTTYNVIASDAFHRAYRSGVNGCEYCPPLEQIRWWRIICDEGHSLKCAQTRNSAAVLRLVADHKWIVSGTPMNTDVSDLKNQLKFLGFEHVDKSFNQIYYYTRSNNGKKEIDMDRLLYYLRPIIMRHSQEQKYRGTATTLMSLPPKTERKESINFTATEKKEFRKIEKEAQEWYLEFRATNRSSISKHFLKLSSRLTPMRIACSGGKYPIDSEERNDEGSECSIPTDVDTKRTNRSVYSKFEFKSKLNKLLAELERIKVEEPDSKSLVFSQFSSTLDWLKTELPKHGFQFRTLSGDMSMTKRAKALADFQNDPPTTIFLLSMRAGAVGINLTQANRVFLMEPSFNPALEAQAIGRIHRLGQKRAVEIIRLVVKDSFEERMVDFLDKKYSQSPAEKHADSPQVDGMKAKGDNQAVDSKRVKGIVGNLKADKAELVISEFDALFGVEGRLEVDAGASADGERTYSDGTAADEVLSSGLV